MQKKGAWTRIICALISWVIITQMTIPASAILIAVVRDKAIFGDGVLEDENGIVRIEYGDDACLPTDTTVTARRIGEELFDLYYSSALTMVEQKITEAVFFDISLISEGKPVQPAAPVKVTINNPETEGIPTILHFADLKEQEASAAGPGRRKAASHISGVTNADSDALAERNDELLSADRISVMDAEAGVTFVADGFSVYGLIYTVEFLGDSSFSIPGGGCVGFRTLAENLGMASDDPETEENEMDLFIDSIESVSFSDPSLLSVYRLEEPATAGEIKERLGLNCVYSAELSEEDIAMINGVELTAPDWALIALQPFSSEETLTVSFRDGTSKTIRTTDAQTWNWGYCTCTLNN